MNDEQSKGSHQRLYSQRVTGSALADRTEFGWKLADNAVGGVRIMLCKILIHYFFRFPRVHTCISRPERALQVHFGCYIAQQIAL